MTIDSLGVVFCDSSHSFSSYSSKEKDKSFALSCLIMRPVVAVQIFLASMLVGILFGLVAWSNTTSIDPNQRSDSSPSAVYSNGGTGAITHPKHAHILCIRMSQKKQQQKTNALLVFQNRHDINIHGSRFSYTHTCAVCLTRTTLMDWVGGLLFWHFSD